MIQKQKILEIVKNNKKALIFGASGLVGTYCLNNLLASDTYKKVISFGRRKLPVVHSKLEQHQIDFEDLKAAASLIKGDDLFICLGTTRGKAGKEGFIKVDFDFTFNAAKYAAINGVNQLILVSSIGADKDSIFLYTKTKGRLEEAVKRLPFWSVHILQPSVLLGARDETRVGELIAGTMGKLIHHFSKGALGNLTPIKAITVAKAMINIAQGIEGGVKVYRSTDLMRMIDDQQLIGRK